MRTEKRTRFPTFVEPSATSYPTAMKVTYSVAFADGYLLVLAPGSESAAGLAHHLDQACRSGKPAVWVDCRLLDKAPPTAIWLLWACQLRLRRRQTKLIFCHVSQVLEQTLRRIFPCPDLCLVPTLDDVVAAS